MSAAMTIVSDSVERTLALGAAVGRLCRPGDVVALVGELGAGKTQFVRGLARGMGLDPAQVSSPTFVIAQEYEDQADEAEVAGQAPGPGELEESAAAPVLVHIDAYRLHGAQELAAMGWAGEGGDLGEGAVVAIEWADRVADGLGDDRLEVRIAHSPASREITVTPYGSWVGRMIPWP